MIQLGFGESLEKAGIERLHTPLLLTSIVAWIFPVGAAKAFIGARKIAVPAADAAMNSRRFIGVISLPIKVF